ncbi:hypothetical protein, partial [Thermoflexibacter ruber]|uniref:hypothetical protein n=1 Tax=Thermoflexibacter ruber TaxID=1003 RepID=UPI001C876B1D
MTQIVPMKTDFFTHKIIIHLKAPLNNSKQMRAKFTPLSDSQRFAAAMAIYGKNHWQTQKI